MDDLDVLRNRATSLENELKETYISLCVLSLEKFKRMLKHEIVFDDETLTIRDLLSKLSKKCRDSIDALYDSNIIDDDDDDDDFTEVDEIRSHVTSLPDILFRLSDFDLKEAIDSLKEL